MRQTMNLKTQKEIEKTIIKIFPHVKQMIWFHIKLEFIISKKEANIINLTDLNCEIRKACNDPEITWIATSYNDKNMKIKIFINEWLELIKRKE